MLTFSKTLITVLVMIVLFGGNIIANKMYYEGSTCSFPGGKLGVCTKLQECKSVDNGLKANTISFANIVQCSFIGYTTVICCPDRTPIETTPTTPHTRPSGGILFEGNVNRRDRNRILPNVISTTTRKPNILFTVKNITITDDTEFIDLTQLLKNREKKLQSSSISPVSTSLQNHPLISSSFQPQTFGKLTSDQTLLNTINFNKNIEIFNNFNRRPPTDASFSNQGNFDNNNVDSNHRNEKHRDRESRESLEQNFNYQTTTIKSTSYDPWAAFEFRPSVTTTSTQYPNWVQSSTQRSREISGEQFQGSAKSSFIFPSELNNHHKVLQQNNNVDVEYTTKSFRYEELSNNNLDPWMKDALNSDRNQQDINSNNNNNNNNNNNDNNNNNNNNNNVGNSGHWAWYTTTHKPFVNSWSTSNQNSAHQDSFSSSNINNFNQITAPPNNNNEINSSPTSTSTSSSLDPWMIDAIQSAKLISSTTNANSNFFTFSENNRPLWETTSDSYDGDVINTPVTRGNTRKAVQACERYKNDLGPRIDFHIIDGEPTKPGEFPHMAGIGYREFDVGEYTWDCGGSLISDRYIITAAHCVDNPKRAPKLIRLGKTTIRNNDDGAEAVDVQITKTSIHPDYRGFAKYHDIALIELAKTVAFNNEVAPACLHTSKDDLSDREILVATGWGVDNVRNRTESNFLLKVNLTSNPLNNCNQSYFDYGFTRQYAAGLHLGQMCAFDPRFNKDSCQGDSGGPLQLVNETIHLSTIVGLTSFGIGCASAIPSVYTRVAYYMDWIESIVWP